MKDYEQYCPVCGRVITASNAEEVRAGKDDGYIFVHDAIPHDDNDVEALQAGIN